MSGDEGSQVHTDAPASVDRESGETGSQPGLEGVHQPGAADKETSSPPPEGPVVTEAQIMEAVRRQGLSDKDTKAKVSQIMKLLRPQQHSPEKPVGGPSQATRPSVDADGGHHASLPSQPSPGQLPGNIITDPSFTMSSLCRGGNIFPAVLKDNLCCIAGHHLPLACFTNFELVNRIITQAPYPIISGHTCSHPVIDSSFFSGASLSLRRDQLLEALDNMRKAYTSISMPEAALQVAGFMERIRGEERFYRDELWPAFATFTANTFMAWVVGDGEGRRFDLKSADTFSRLDSAIRNHQDSILHPPLIQAPGWISGWDTNATRSFMASTPSHMYSLCLGRDHGAQGCSAPPHRRH